MILNSIEELSDQDLLELTEEQIERRIKLNMAEEGIPIYAMPQEPVYAEVEPPDGEFYTFSRIFTDIAFKSAEGLKEVVDLMQALGCERLVKDYNDPIGRHEPNILKAQYSHETEFTISSEKLYGPESYKRSKAILKDNQLRKKEHEEEVKKVKASTTAEQKFRDEIWVPIRAAQTRRMQCQQADLQFAEYLNLAEKDAAQAWKFYKKAHNPERHIEEHLKEKNGLPLVWKGGDDK